MIIDRNAALKIAGAGLAFALLVSHLGLLLFPAFVRTLDDQGIDRLQRLLYAFPPSRPAYRGDIVHVDLNNSSLKRLESHHPDRADHALVIRNLNAMDVAVQMLDFVYTGTTSTGEDEALVHAVEAADTVLIGVALRIRDTGPFAADARAPVPGHVLAGEAAQDFSGCTELLPPFAALAEAAAGAGYLTLASDKDGVFRRLPLMVRCGDGFFPSFALAAVGRYLEVPLDQIVVHPGEIRLPQARFPGETQPRELVIPIDTAGRMRVNYTGPWGRMAHYQFADIFLASRDQDAMEIWREELAGKIILISDVTTGAADVGRTPLDVAFPLSGVHANAVHTILTETFLAAAPWHVVLLIDAFLLAAMLILALRRSAVVFTLAVLSMALVYLAITALVLHLSGTILPMVQPLAMLVMGMFTLLIASSVANTRTHARTETARQLAERDLDIGRRIQASFLPSDRHQPSGWQVATHFKPARQVSGDFYDIFELGQGRFMAVVVADVCDKGVGAALFMALIRSLIRAFALQDFNALGDLRENPVNCTDAAILNTVRQTNHYLAVTHGETGMFATLFLGILELGSGRMRYVNCGHEPPWGVGPAKAIDALMPTGPALGVMPDSPFTVGGFTFRSGQTLIAFTDGLTESESSSGQAFGRERLTALVADGFGGAQALVDRIVQSLAAHTSGQTPFDDITIVAVHQEGGASEATHPAQ